MNAAIDQAVMANRYDIAKYVSDVAVRARLKPPMIHCGCSGLTPVRKRWPMTSRIRKNVKGERPTLKTIG